MTHSQTEVGWNIIYPDSLSVLLGGLNLNLMKTESLWHLNQHAAGYGSSYGQSPHYGLPSSPLPTGAVL